jgi:hypothetical protein
MRVLKYLLQHSGPFVLGVVFLAAGVATVDAGSPSKLYVAGDSIGVGIAEAAHLPSVASGSARPQLWPPNWSEFRLARR